MAADGLERALNLYGLLLRAHAQDPLTSRAAAEAVADRYTDYEGESGRKALTRDREHLRRAGVTTLESSVTETPGAPGWWIPHERFHLPGLQLTDEERKGKSVFESPRTQCATCHAPGSGFTSRA